MAKEKKTEPEKPDTPSILDLVGQRVHVYPHNESLIRGESAYIKMRLAAVDLNAGLYVLKSAQRILYVSFDNAEIVVQ